jgi:hypothetical protein
MTVPTNPLAALSRAVDPTVLRSIRQASDATATDFGLLMAQAGRESGFRADAKSSTSSAAGLFQFVDSTWLDMVHRFGDKYGAGDLARQISQTSNGKLVVADADTRQKILDLRQDPAMSASLAAEYAKQNQSEMEQSLGRPLSRGDLYLAHFLGAGGATHFLRALDSKGDMPAAKLLPDAAAANRSIFYDSAGHARSVRDLYLSMTAKIESEASTFAGNAVNTSPSLPPLPSFALASIGSTPGFGADALGSAAGGGTSTFGRAIDWAGVKLSAPMLHMLNIVALAALKMTQDSADPRSRPQSPALPGTPRLAHSV